MRISDWSSDVCSSDLGQLHGEFAPRQVPLPLVQGDDRPAHGGQHLPIRHRTPVDRPPGLRLVAALEIGTVAEAADLAVVGAEAPAAGTQPADILQRSEEHTSELQSLMRISYAVFCLKKKKAA